MAFLFFFFFNPFGGVIEKVYLFFFLVENEKVDLLITSNPHQKIRGQQRFTARNEGRRLKKPLVLKSYTNNKGVIDDKERVMKQMVEGVGVQQQTYRR